MTIAVTGAGGFIGQHLVRTLAKRWNSERVVCLVRSAEQASALKALGVRTVLGDLLDSQTVHAFCQDATHIIHLAAHVLYGIGIGSDADFHASNVEATVRLLETCPPSTQRFIYISTMLAVGRPPEDPCGEPLTEMSPAHPITPYGRSKRIAEEAIRRIAPNKKINYLILQPPAIVYGAGCKKNSGMATLIRGTVSGSLLTRLNFPGRVSILHVQDLVDAILQMGLSDEIRNDTFLLADEPPRTLSEIAEEVAAQLGIRRRCVTLPQPFFSAVNASLNFLAKIPGVGQKIPFQLWVALRDYAAVSSQKARRLAGFRSRVSLREGLKETIPWVLRS